MMKVETRVPGVLILGLILGGVAACGGGDTDSPGAADAVTEMPFDVSTAGSVQGMVMFEGTAPPPEPLSGMESERSCWESYDEPPAREWVKVRDGHLAEVFVYVKEGLEGMEFPVPQEAVVIDQSGCRYIPSVLGAMVNQAITLRNSDGLLHNINATPAENRGFNIGQPVNMETNRSFALPEVMIPIRCDVHGWMSAWLGVLSHPYHTVTGDAGTFSLADLPPGEYVIEAWHPRLGSQEQTITVTTGETTSVSFTFSDATLSHAPSPVSGATVAHVHPVPSPSVAMGR
ncbi:MAG: carboxypeptidase regulatory-like domain-containing protein [Gemmatimonadota bacterium]